MKFKVGDLVMITHAEDDFAPKTTGMIGAITSIEGRWNGGGPYYELDIPADQRLVPSHWILLPGPSGGLVVHERCLRKIDDGVGDWSEITKFSNWYPGKVTEKEKEPERVFCSIVILDRLVGYWPLKCA